MRCGDRQHLTPSAPTKRLWRDKRGVTGVLLALLLPIFFGFAAMGIDFGLWTSTRRVDQGAADAAALSGALELASGKGVPGGPATTDIQNLALYSAGNNLPGSLPATLTVATGCTNPDANQLCVNNPPLIGTWGDEYVEAILGEQGLTIFAGMVGFNQGVLRTRAVAGLVYSPTCMIALNTTGQDLRNNGNVTLTLNGCTFASDSSDRGSITLNGTVSVTAAAITTVGGAVISGNSASVSPPITANAAAVADPYAGLVTFTGLAGVPSLGCVSPAASDPPKTLQPGIYGGACANGSTPPWQFLHNTTTICPGVYFLDGADNQHNALEIHNTGNAVTTVNMGVQGSGGCPANGSTGVTVISVCVAAGSPAGSGCAGGFEIGSPSDTPTVHLSAPPDPAPPSSFSQTAIAGVQPGYSIPYDILFWQDPTPGKYDARATNTLSGNANVQLSGVIDTEKTPLVLSGNPTFSNCTEIIALSFTVSGNPTMNRPASCGVRTQFAAKIALVE
jgi:hypothetical protein